MHPAAFRHHEVKEGVLGADEAVPYWGECNQKPAQKNPTAEKSNNQSDHYPKKSIQLRTPKGDCLWSRGINCLGQTINRLWFELTAKHSLGMSTGRRRRYRPAEGLSERLAEW